MQLFCQISQRTWNTVLLMLLYHFLMLLYHFLNAFNAQSILMLLYQVYTGYGKTEVFSSCIKPSSKYSNLLNKCKMAKWVCTHRDDGVREKHFLSCGCNIFGPVPATLKTSWLQHSVTAWVSQTLPAIHILFSMWIQVSLSALCGSDGIQL